MLSTQLKIIIFPSSGCWQQAYWWQTGFLEICFLATWVEELTINFPTLGITNLAIMLLSTNMEDTVKFTTMWEVLTINITVRTITMRSTQKQTSQGVVGRRAAQMEVK